MLQSTVIEGNSFGMNTEITYRICGEKAELAVASAKSELLRLENLLSRFLPDSEVGKVNQSAGLGRVEISCELYELLSFAYSLSELSQGLFDITVAPLIDLWDYKHSLQAPAESRICSILPKIDYHKLTLNPVDQTVGLCEFGQSIDLGGIGKGYASDRCIEVFQQHGIRSAYINIGGNVSTLGNKPEDAPWSVGIRHPRKEGCLIGAVKVTGKAVVTSGDYERYFLDWEGKRWHHILSPITGYPAESELISVTVVADSAMVADALSTAIFVSGMKRGLGYLKQFPRTEAILVDNLQQVYITQNLKECFQVEEGIKVSVIGCFE